MSRETVSIILDCGLESGGRWALLSGLAHYANDETSVAHVSTASLKIVTRLGDSQLRKLRREMLATATGHGLLQAIEPFRPGRHSRARIWINVRRLAPVAAAVREARRGIFAGAARALEQKQLIGADATFENCFAVMRTLAEAVRDEATQAEYVSEPKRCAELTARVAAIETQIAVLEAVQIGEQNGEVSPAPSRRKKCSKSGQKPAEIRRNETRRNSADMGGLSADGETLSADFESTPPTPPYKDIPQGNTSTRACAARGEADLRQGVTAQIAGLIASGDLSANAGRWLPGVDAVIVGASLVLMCPGRATADRLSGSLSGEMGKLASRLGCETFRVEG